ncbi:MAG TPA: FkbM family methyltransferase, partial [Gaiellaceae bacterium]
MSSPRLPALVTAAADSRAGHVARTIVSRTLGGRPRVVRVLSGVARGARLELDLGLEKAYWIGHYEAESQAFLQAHLKPGDVVYDVGAHHGFFSVCAARLGATVVAFEPAAENVERIRRQARLNVARIEVVEAAVWDSDSGVALHSGGSSSEWTATEGGLVRSVTIDEFAATSRPPDFVKIDAEGAESRVLRGATRVLERFRPTVLCECHGDPARDEVVGLLTGY